MMTMRISDIQDEGIRDTFMKAAGSEDIEITSMTEHAKRHGVTQEMAQYYIDHSLVRIKQTPDKFEYLAKDGTVISIIPPGRVVSAWSQSDYDQSHSNLIREVAKCLEEK